MTISVGQTASASLNDSTAASSVTTGSVTTSASGSAFVIISIERAGTTPVLASDSKGNTYTQIGSEISNTSGTPTRIDRFYVAGATGGSGHTFTATLTSGTARFFICAIEIIAGLTTGILDQSNTNIATQAAPFSSGNITLNSANTANGELMISAVANDAGTSTSWSEANGFTIAANSLIGGSFPHSIEGAVGYKIVSSSGTYNASWSDGSSGSPRWVASIDSFIGAGSDTLMGAQWQ